jgi:protein-disulfide isomerase
MKSRNLLLIVALIAVIAAAAIFYFVSRPNEAAIPQTATSTPATATPGAAGNTAATAPAAKNDDMMAPGPLGEKALGDPKAPNTVIEYASMTCSHCQRFHAEVYKDFKAKYIDTGKVYFIFREFPLDPLATSAIMLARCGPDDNFFPLVDLLFDHQKEWAFVDDPATALLNLVKQAGFTQDSFKACLTNQKILDGVNAVKDRGAAKFGVDSTPTFFFNGVKKSGEQTLEDIRKILGS